MALHATDNVALCVTLKLLVKNNTSQEKCQLHFINNGVQLQYNVNQLTRFTTPS